MTLSELKALLGIPTEDTSKDAYYTLMLESALLAAQEYCDRLDFLTLVDTETGLLVLPAAVKLGIAEWVKANEGQAARSGIASESIGGMSQSFVTTGSDVSVYGAAFMHWRPYHSAIRFYPMGARP